MRAWLASALVAGVVGCTTSGPPVLPAGIAELQLPADAGTLRRIAAEDEATGRLERRGAVLAGLNRALLMAAPPGDLVPELFDSVMPLAPRTEAGTGSPAWGSYLYRTYQRDLTAEQAKGRPRRTMPEVDAMLDRWIDFYQIRANPRVAWPTVESGGFEATQDWRSQRRMGR